MYKWLYKDTIESGVMVLLEEVSEYKKQGYVDTPDDYTGDKSIYVLGESTIEKEGQDGAFDDCALEDMTKADLEAYAKVQFGVDIDRRKSKTNLIKEIEALEER